MAGGSTAGRAARFMRAAMVVCAVLGLVAVVVSWAAPSRLVLGYTAHELGPIGPADRDLLYRVRQAGLWEMPVGHEGVTRAATPEYRDVAARISVEHMELDAAVRGVAQQLGVALPDDPTPDQRAWMADITSRQGLDYDRTAVFLLRAAHGKILPALAAVRAGTRNSAIREFADVAIVYVNRHMNYLDGTGLVDFAALPESPAPSAYQVPEVADYWTSRDPRTLVVAAVLAVVVAGLLGALVRSHWSTPALQSPRRAPARHALRRSE